MTSGQTHCGVTKKEYFDIQSLCSGDPLEDEMMAVLDATYDQTMGTRPHSISLARFDKYASYDKRLGGQILNDLMNGKLRFFTKAIGDAATRVSAWRGNDPGSRIMMIKVLQSAVANGCNLMNLVSAMECQVRTYSGATDDLQPALVLPPPPSNTVLTVRGLCAIAQDRVEFVRLHLMRVLTELSRLV